MMEQFMVQYVAEYLVEAKDKEEALEIGMDRHQDMPQGEWLITRMN
jgi:hypothetical protein